MAKAASASVPAAELALYEALVATRSDVQRRGASVPYTSLNGHMFSFLTKTGTLALRLSAADREAFVAKYATPPCVQHGAVMKDYVEVPAELLAATAKLKKYFDASHDYVAALKPKATTRKKAPAAKNAPAKTSTSKKTKAAAKKTPASKKTAAKKAR